MAHNTQPVHGGTLTLITDDLANRTDGEVVEPIAVDSPAWRERLARGDTIRFRYEAGPLRFTAHRRMRRSAWHWYATRQHHGRRREVALGTAADLTPERLRQAAEALASMDARDEPARAARHPPTQAHAAVITMSPSAPPVAPAGGSAKLAGDAAPQNAAAGARIPLQPLPLLVTKLFIPPIRQGIVPRPRLSERLDEGLRAPLTVLAAPAGWGKTTAVAAWCADVGRDDAGSAPQPAVAWVSLDAGDNDPVRFWTYVLTALNTACAGVASEALVWLRSPQPPPLELPLTLLLNGLATLETGVVLVLDDYHVIEAETVHATIAFLLDHLPPRCHLVLATREDPPLPLARRRVQGTVTELRAADLRFTPEEAAEFLTAALDVQSTPEIIMALVARSEGWIAGLQLAALSLHGRSRHEMATLVSAFASSNRYIVDYLVEEVLARQPPEVQTFLLRTAIVERFCAPLCEELLAVGAGAGSAGTAGESAATQDGREGQPLPQRQPVAAIPPNAAIAPPPLVIAALLEQVESANLFLMPLDDERRWYRYHHLFADVLRSRLRRQDPSLAAALHRRASDWFQRQALVAEAVQQALAAPDFERAVELIERYGLGLGLAGQVETVLGWIRALPEALIREHPLLCVCHANLLFGTGQIAAVESAEARLRDAEAAVAASYRAGMAESALRPILGMVAAVRSLFGELVGDEGRSVALARQALDLLNESDATWYQSARFFASRSYRVTGSVTRADEQALAEGTEALRASGNLLVALPSATELARLQMLQGRLRAAAATYEEAALMLPESLRLEDVLPGADYLFAVAEVPLERNDLDEADRLLTRGMQLLGRWAIPACAVTQGYLALARLQAARGAYTVASATLDAFEQVARGRGFAPELVQRGAAMRAQLAIAAGDILAAAAWADASELSSAVAVLAFQHEPAFLALARLRIAQGRGDPGGSFLREAERLLERLLADAESNGRGHSVLEILVLRAMALQARRHTRDALWTLAHALTLAAPEGYVRLFADEGAPMAALLAELLEASRRRRLALPQAVLDYAQFLLGVCRSPDGGTAARMPHTSQDGAPQSKSPTPGVPPLLDPLTAREVEVLRLLAEGAPNAAIAAALVVTVGAVKKHVFNICGKLGAQNRTQAVARARALHLL